MSLVTEPVYLLPPAAANLLVVGALVVLEGPEGRHAATVRRTRVGERVVLADGAGRWGRGEVSQVGRDAVSVLIDEAGTESEPAPRLVLAQALAKADRDELAIEVATELGVDAVIPWQAERSIVQWRGERAEKARAKWRGVLHTAAKQARRVRLPVLEESATTRQLADRVRRCSLSLVLHEEAAVPITEVELPSCGDVLIVVGPEGGISPAEVDLLTAAGARTVRLGPHVLRSSSAGPAALAVLSARGRWR